MKTRSFSLHWVCVPLIILSLPFILSESAPGRPLQTQIMEYYIYFKGKFPQFRDRERIEQAFATKEEAEEARQEIAREGEIHREWYDPASGSWMGTAGEKEAARQFLEDTYIKEVPTGRYADEPATSPEPEARPRPDPAVAAARRAEFERRKQEIIARLRTGIATSSFDGDRGNPINRLKDGTSTSSSNRENADPVSRLKLGTTTRRGGEAGFGKVITLPAWNLGEIADPQVRPIASSLERIKVPPLPIPADKVSFERLRSVSDNAEDYLTGLDWGLMTWDVIGHVSGALNGVCTVTVIAGKTLIAGAEGGLVFMTKKNGEYDSALSYLKRPQTAQPFARLVAELKAGGAASKQSLQEFWKLKEAGVLSDEDYRGIVGLARLVASEKSSAQLAFDSMLSPEALSAMVKKACFEIGSWALSERMTGYLADVVKRKDVFDAIRLERTRAVHMLKDATDPVRIGELNRVIAHANKQIHRLYHIQGVVPKFGSFLAGSFLFEEAEKSLDSN